MKFIQKKKFDFELAEKLNCTFDKRSRNVRLGKIAIGIQSEEFIDNLLYEKHIFLTPGTIFGSNGEGYIRFSLCVKEENISMAISKFNHKIQI